MKLRKSVWEYINQLCVLVNYVLRNLIIDSMKKKIALIVICGVVVFLFFELFINKPAKKMYCIRQINVKIANFRTVAFRLGVIPIDEEEKYIENIKKNLYIRCLLKENISE